MNPSQENPQISVHYVVQDEAIDNALGWLGDFRKEWPCHVLLVESLLQELRSRRLEARMSEQRELSKGVNMTASEQTEIVPRVISWANSRLVRCPRCGCINFFFADEIVCKFCRRDDTTPDWSSWRADIPPGAHGLVRGQE